MCGIVGINSLDKTFINESIISLKHRGPDGNGTYFSKNVSFGHVRLSIIELTKKGSQPMYSKNKNLIITFNGEIYNYQEIKKELENLGHKFNSNSDTEIILEAYIRWGEKCVKKFDGMWAFCIHDIKNNKLFLSRDLFGEKPLYIYNHNNTFAFSSEIRVFMENKKFKLTLSNIDINNYFYYGYVRANKSIFKEIFKLKPGHNLIYNLKTNKINIIKFKLFNINSKIKKQKEFNQIFDKTFNNSIKNRLVSDVEVGAFLSGGTDSSAVVAIASKYSNKIKTFSIGFDTKEFDETKYAKIVSKKYKTKHHIEKLDINKTKKIIKKLPIIYDEPYGNASSIPTLLVSEMTKKHVNVCLSGDAADELYDGYFIYRLYRWFSYQRFIPKKIRIIIKWILNKLSKYNPKFNKINKYIIETKFSKSKLCNLIYNVENNKTYYKLFGKLQSNPFQTYEKYPIGKDIQLFDIENSLVENVLVKVDKASMRHSLETRMPFLNKEVSNIGFKISGKLLSNLKVGKTGLKKYFEKYLPFEIMYRTKKGFGLPINKYLKNELKNYVKKYIINYNSHNYYNQNEMKKIGENFLKNNNDEYHLIWKIITFNMWYDYWILKKRDE